MEQETCMFEHSFYTKECDYYITGCGYTFAMNKKDEIFEYCPYCGKPRGY